MHGEEEIIHAQNQRGPSGGGDFNPIQLGWEELAEKRGLVGKNFEKMSIY